ncbi:MAG: hypothetical protein C0508_09285 [Cyanobacteria bacterium PR.023]|jgi:predicted DNA binding CopG/RHH family protein|nr:hypothetical protein [Cyanobacteria bacterium PR.023]MDQ5934675.1 hypothetical protein [Cyanobacteriota bacterium erpe_2018_sw_21hr_WHONDRS-SW48-000092_B_bin.40]
MTKRKSKRGNFEIEDLGDVELSPELDKQVKEMTAEADEQVDSTRVNFRWQKEPLNLVKRVSEAMGIPYQTYIKHVVYNQAMEDLNKIKNSTTPD